MAIFERLLSSWFDANAPATHQLVSFDKFLEHKLQEIILENSHVVAENDKTGSSTTLHFQSVHLRQPALREADGSYHRVTPHECRLRGLSYNVSVYVNVLQEIRDRARTSVDRKLFAEVLLCRIPCMVGCLACASRFGDIGECTLDRGGYFIVNGNEKKSERAREGVVAQEKMRTNFVFVRSTSPKCLTAEIRSLHVTKTRSTSTLLVHLSARAGLRAETLEVRLPFVEMGIPAGVIFKLLGLETLDAICEFVTRHCPARTSCFGDLARRSLDHVLLNESRPNLIEHLGREGTKEATMQRRTRYIEHILSNEFLPHQGLDASSEVQHRKATFLAVIVCKLLRVYLKERPEDDRDDYAIKRVETTGGLFALLFRQLFRQFLKTLGLQLSRAVEGGKPVSIVDLLHAKKITAGMKYAVSTGNWGIQKQASQNGVAQVLTRMNFLAGLSHLRRVNTPINREGKLPKPRQLSASHYGILCPVETPEGQACGLVENLAILAHVRQATDGSYIVAALRSRGLMRNLDDVSCTPWGNHWRVAVNGSIEGFCDDGIALAQELRSWRRNLVLPLDTSIAAVPMDGLLVIDSDGGCLLRPLLVRKEMHRLPGLVACTPPWELWNALLLNGVVEFIDKIEEQCVRMGDTHEELHPSCMLGICAGMIPFLNHNQAPRNIYEAAMTKQAIGLYSTEASRRMDAVAHVLHYPQQPLVQTSALALGPCLHMPSGINVIVAVLSYTGFNQEDSIIFNQGALERGLFRSSIYKSFKDEEKNIGSDVERFGVVPSTATGARKADYSKIAADGLPLIGEEMENGDVIVGKRMQAVQLGTDRKKRVVQVDHSSILSASEVMRVNKIILTTNKDGGKLVRVKLHAVRVPEIGDKFSSHHGQKGVIGLILPQCDMPFTIDGISPDLIINPHALCAP